MVHQQWGINKFTEVVSPAALRSRKLTRLTGTLRSSCASKARARVVPVSSTTETVAVPRASGCVWPPRPVTEPEVGVSVSPNQRALLKRAVLAPVSGRSTLWLKVGW